MPCMSADMRSKLPQFEGVELPNFEGLQVPKLEQAGVLSACRDPKKSGRQRWCTASYGGLVLPGVFDETDHDVVGVTVEVAAGPVIPRGHPWVAVPRGDLHITQRNPGVQAGEITKACRSE